MPAGLKGCGPATPDPEVGTRWVQLPRLEKCGLATFKQQRPEGWHGPTGNGPYCLKLLSEPTRSQLCFCSCCFLLPSCFCSLPPAFLLLLLALLVCCAVLASQTKSSSQTSKRAAAKARKGGLGRTQAARGTG